MQSFGNLVGQLIISSVTIGMLWCAWRWPRGSASQVGAFGLGAVGATLGAQSSAVIVGAFMGVFLGSMIGGIVDLARGRAS